MHSLIHTKKKFCFRIPLKYFEFTIEVNGKNWYIGLYHAQPGCIGTPNAAPCGKIKTWVKYKNQHG